MVVENFYTSTCVNNICNLAYLYIVVWWLPDDWWPFHKTLVEMESADKD